MKTILLSTLFILVTYSFVLGQNNFTLEYTSPAGESFRTVINTEKNNQIPEIITQTGSYPNTVYKIYDGATHILKRTLTFPGVDSSYIKFWDDNITTTPADVNNDGIYDLILYNQALNYNIPYVKIVNGANGNVLFSYYGATGNSLGRDFADIDGDGYLELLIKDNNSSSYLITLKVYSTPATVGVINNSIQVPNYELKQNYPNPFNPSTTIEYSIKKTADVQIKIYDISGRELQSLSKGVQGSGTYKVNLTSENLSSGTYFYQIVVDGISEAKKMILLK